MADVASLYGIQAATFLVPLVTLPYLTRVLGPDGWGRLAFADSLGRSIAVLVEFGFQLSATRAISEVRGSAEERALRVSGILGGQALLALAVTVLMALVMLASGAARGRGAILWVALAQGCALAFSPIWYFQAMERARVMASLDIIAKALSALAILTLVHHPGDEMKALAAVACAAALSAASGILLIRRETPFGRPTWRGGVAMLREALALFVFRGAVNLYTGANALLLGLFVPPTVVGYFAGAEKLARAALAALTPLNQTAFPRIAHLARNNPAQAGRVARLSLRVMLGVGVTTAIALWMGADWIVRTVLGRGFEPAAGILRILALLVPLVAASNVLGIQWMVPLRMERAFISIIVCAGLTNVVLALTLVRPWGAPGMAFSVLASELVVTTGSWSYLYWRGRTPWSLNPEIGSTCA
jgi:PST family polysaccharide transporter